MFFNQVFFIVGLSFSPAHIASIWQTTQPIMTVVITLLLRTEAKNWTKIIGVFLAAIGAFIVSFFTGHGSSQKGVLLGSCFFFINCLSNSLFVIISKPLVKKYPAVTVTTLSYTTCSILVFIVTICFYGRIVIYFRCLMNRSTLCLDDPR